VLCTFKEQLQQHVRVHAVEAVMACRDIENTLQALTGIHSTTIHFLINPVFIIDLSLNLFFIMIHSLYG
jgi:hypothetical protein